jgi:hypothetical protein
MSSASEKLLRLADEAERTAAAYRLAATALNGHATSKRVERSETVLDDALAVDAARRAHKSTRGPDKKKRKQTGEAKAAKIATRRQTAATLDALDTSKPTTLDDWRAKIGGRKIGIGVLVHAGFIRPKAGGWIRTAKVFDPEHW